MLAQPHEMMSGTNGQPLDFEAVVRDCGQRLYRSAFLFTGDAEDAQDLVQETFLEAHKGWQSFEGRSGPYTWLYRILLRRWNRLRRKRQKRRSTSLDIEKLEIPDAAPGPADHSERRDALAQTQTAIAELPEPYRVVVIMKYYEEWSCEQIAAAVGVSPSRVRARLTEARRQLQKKLVSRFGDIRASYPFPPVHL